MYKNKKILTIYFISFLISPSIFFGTLDQVVNLSEETFNANEKEIVFKKVNNFYVPVETVPVKTSPINTTPVKKGVINKTNVEKKLKEHDLVVFIHGTILPFPSATTIIQTLKGDKKSPLRKKSFFYKYMNNTRYKGLFKYQPINDTGLKRITFSKKKNISVQEKSSNKIAGCYDNYCKLLNTKNSRSYYTFGWSGHLNQKRRRGWADRLYTDLIKEIEKIKKSEKTFSEETFNVNVHENNNINITILAHSHGGNVVLKLADSEKKYKKGLKIKKTILFGTPVQRETSQAIYSNIFEKIYNIYSRGDPVQVIDCISTKDTFSKRKFWKKNGVLPSKLVQIEILCGKLKPMHNELWFLKSKWNLFYRKRLSVAPFPVSVFTPEIVKIVDEHFAQNSNLQLNIKKEKSKKTFNVNKYKLSFKDLDKADSTYKYFVDFPHA